MVRNHFHSWHRAIISTKTSAYACASTCSTSLIQRLDIAVMHSGSLYASGFSVSNLASSLSVREHLTDLINANAPALSVLQLTQFSGIARKALSSIEPGSSFPRLKVLSCPYVPKIGGIPFFHVFSSVSILEIAMGRHDKPDLPNTPILLANLKTLIFATHVPVHLEWVLPCLCHLIFRDDHEGGSTAEFDQFYSRISNGSLYLRTLGIGRQRLNRSDIWSSIPTIHELVVGWYAFTSVIVKIPLPEWHPLGRITMQSGVHTQDAARGIPEMLERWIPGRAMDVQILERDLR